MNSMSQGIVPRVENIALEAVIVFIKKAQQDSKFLKFSLINGSTLDDLIRSCFLLKIFSINHSFFYVVDFSYLSIRKSWENAAVKTKHGKKQDRAPG